MAAPMIFYEAGDFADALFRGRRGAGYELQEKNPNEVDISTGAGGINGAADRDDTAIGEDHFCGR
ncbi:MAG: hypothetical protein M0Z50_14875 [Planctomycetia bacterium]|nr:hypothetical protein [Planctomycetia bacterium]